jgi:DNA mismatch repair protein MutS
MSTSVKKTPMMEQYLSIKAKHQDAVLFFRMGDFYEMFFEDAKIASDVLGLTLTRRAHGKSADVPLAGFPHHSLDGYLVKMIQAGFRVAICEQLEDPKQAKTVVKRDVTEIVTPGTAFSDELLDSKRNNFLVSIYIIDSICGLAFADISTGEFSVAEVALPDMADEIDRTNPSEILISEEQEAFIQKRLAKLAKIFVTKRENWLFSREYGYETLTRHFGTLSLKGFGCDDLTAGICAAGAVLHYLKEMQKSRLEHITGMKRLSGKAYMTLDSDTRRNLELLRSIRRGTSEGTLISVLDRTCTAMGGRRLVQWLLQPLVDPSEITARLDSVEELQAAEGTLDILRNELHQVGDIERIVSKVMTSRASARDIVALKSSLTIIPKLQSLLQATEAHLLQDICSHLDGLTPLVDEIGRAIVDDPPLAITEGGIIRRDYNKALDDYRDIAYSGKDWIARLQKEEKEKTGIPSLKVNFNKVFGYYIEVTRANLGKVPEYYIRKQTLVNAERFITPELKAYEEKVLEAEDKIFTLEYELFDHVRALAAEHARSIQNNARLISILDCLSGLATIATEHDYVRPEINTSTRIEIEEGRHPVVEKLLPYGESFIPNSTHLDNDTEQLIILTGPNMAGKSTYLRQVGLIVLMAQLGSFVPARRAVIGVTDKIFTRVGASDNLAGGESTFLVEMNETANILNNATPRSLVLLDEIGRGTSTFDGLSIAWAVAEHLHNSVRVAAKSIFATHYHELTELALILPRVRNYNVVVKEWGDNVVFLRRIEAGACDHSYGIQVAKLAGLPESVIGRAKEILSNLEANELAADKTPKLAQHHNSESDSREKQIDMFAKTERRLQEMLSGLDVNAITPVEALLKLDELKKLANGVD